MTDLQSTPTAALIAAIRCDVANERAAVLELCERMELYEWFLAEKRELEIYYDDSSFMTPVWCVKVGRETYLGMTPVLALRQAMEKLG